VRMSKQTDRRRTPTRELRIVSFANFAYALSSSAPGIPKSGLKSLSIRTLPISGGGGLKLSTQNSKLKTDRSKPLPGCATAPARVYTLYPAPDTRRLPKSGLKSLSIRTLRTFSGEGPKTQKPPLYPVLMQSFKRILAILFGGLAMLAVALVCAYLSMRVAIHGREVAVPNLAGLSDEDAAAAAKDQGLNLSIENRFYSSAVAPNHVLSQSPVAGARVRSGWQVRVTESLGPQTVSVPDVTGQTERPATLVLRRLQLDPGTIAHLPAPAPAGIVLAQSPPPNSRGLNGPRVALLVSDDDTAAAETDAPAFVMPSLIGLSVSAASMRLATAGLHIAGVQNPATPPEPDAPAAASAEPPADHYTTSFYPPKQAFSIAATIAAQSPAPGHRITAADPIRVTLSQ